MYCLTIVFDHKHSTQRYSCKCFEGLCYNHGTYSFMTVVFSCRISMHTVEHESDTETSEEDNEVTGSQGTSVQSASNVPTTGIQHTSVQSASNVTTTGSQGTHLQSASNVPTTSYPNFSRLEDQHLFPEELAMVRETEFICSSALFLNLLKKCQHLDCPNVASTKHHIVGPTLVVNWTCPTGHKGKFASPKDLEVMYANNLQVAASILLSGNNSAKIEKMANFLG